MQHSHNLGRLDAPSYATATHLGQTPTSRTLVELPEDIIVRTLGICSVRDIHIMQQTCRYMHRLASTRDVWLAVVFNLPPEQSPNMRPFQHLHLLSAECLRSIAIRAIRGFHNWISPNHTYSRKFNLYRDYFPDNGSVDSDDSDDASLGLLRNSSSVMLLPGGQHILFYYCGYFDLRVVASNTNIWTYQVYRDPCRVFFDCESTWTENGFILTVVALVVPDADPSQNTVQVIKFDGALTQTAVKRKRILPATLHGRRMLYMCAYIRGDFVIVATDKNEGQHYVFLMNWKDGSCVMLGLPATRRIVPNPQSIAQIVDGRLLFLVWEDTVVLASTPIQQFSALWSTSELYGEWNYYLVPRGSFHLRTLHGLPITSDDTICRTAFTVYQPVCPEDPHAIINVLVACEQRIPNDDEDCSDVASSGEGVPASLAFYRLRHQPSPGLGLPGSLYEERRNYLMTDYNGKLWNITDPSVAGRSMVLTEDGECLAVSPSGPDGGAYLARMHIMDRNSDMSKWTVHMDPWSGAITYITEREVVVLNYD